MSGIKIDRLKYNEDYYERGLQTGKSLYQNYRWLPEMTIAMAMVMIDYLDISRGAKVLDFGCAKGYLVKAFRILGRKASGIDISGYALENCDPDVVNFCFFPMENNLRFPFDLCIAKDVFEHMGEEELSPFLKTINTDRIFVVAPLGHEGGYNAPINNMDQTHIICEDSCWWANFFNENGWEVIKFTKKIPGIKDSYYEKYPDAHGFFTIERIKA